MPAPKKPFHRHKLQEQYRQRREAAEANLPVEDRLCRFGVPNAWLRARRLQELHPLGLPKMKQHNTDGFLATFASKATVATRIYQVERFNFYCREEDLANTWLEAEQKYVLEPNTVNSFCMQLVTQEFCKHTILGFSSAIFSLAVKLEFLKKCPFALERRTQVNRDIRTVAARHDPQQAPVITREEFDALSNSVEKPYRGSLILWTLLGCRLVALTAIPKGGLLESESTRTWIAKPREDKSVATEGASRMGISIKCNCYWSKVGEKGSEEEVRRTLEGVVAGKRFLWKKVDAYCPVCNEGLFVEPFPWGTRFIDALLREAGKMARSPRRTLATALKLWELSFPTKKEGKFNAVFRWSKGSGMFKTYSSDYKMYGLHQMIPIVGVLHRVDDLPEMLIDADFKGCSPGDIELIEQNLGVVEEEETMPYSEMEKELIALRAIVALRGGVNPKRELQE